MTLTGRTSEIAEFWRISPNCIANQRVEDDTRTSSVILYIQSYARGRFNSQFLMNLTFRFPIRARGYRYK